MSGHLSSSFTPYYNAFNPKTQSFELPLSRKERINQYSSYVKAINQSSSRISLIDVKYSGPKAPVRLLPGRPRSGNGVRQQIPKPVTAPPLTPRKRPGSLSLRVKPSGETLPQFIAPAGPDQGDASKLEVPCSTSILKQDINKPNPFLKNVNTYSIGKISRFKRKPSSNPKTRSVPVPQNNLQKTTNLKQQSNKAKSKSAVGVEIIKQSSLDFRHGTGASTDIPTYDRFLELQSLERLRNSPLGRPSSSRSSNSLNDKKRKCVNRITKNKHESTQISLLSPKVDLVNLKKPDELPYPRSRTSNLPSIKDVFSKVENQNDRSTSLEAPNIDKLKLKDSDAMESDNRHLGSTFLIDGSVISSSSNADALPDSFAKTGRQPQSKPDLSPIKSRPVTRNSLKTPESIQPDVNVSVFSGNELTLALTDVIVTRKIDRNSTTILLTIPHTEYVNTNPFNVEKIGNIQISLAGEKDLDRKTEIMKRPLSPVKPNEGINSVLSEVPYHMAGVTHSRSRPTSGYSIKSKAGSIKENVKAGSFLAPKHDSGYSSPTTPTKRKKVKKKPLRKSPIKGRNNKNDKNSPYGLRRLSCEKNESSIDVVQKNSRFIEKEVTTPYGKQLRTLRPMVRAKKSPPPTADGSAVDFRKRLKNYSSQVTKNKDLSTSSLPSIKKRERVIKEKLNRFNSDLQINRKRILMNIQSTFDGLH